MMQWCVVSFIETHNHSMVTPSKRCYLGIDQCITPLSRALFQSLDSFNISSSDRYSVATIEAGGFEAITFIPLDFSNMRRDDRQNICSHDVDLLIEHMNKRVLRKTDYYYTKHEDGKCIAIVL